MISVEIYIVKKDNYNNYKIKNTMGIGYQASLKVDEFDKLSGPMVVGKQDASGYYHQQKVGSEGNTPFSLITNNTIMCAKYLCGQIIDTIETPFRILVNGLRLENITDYHISDEAIILFTNPLEAGDKLEIHDVTENNYSITSKNSYNKNAIFKLFNSSQKFKYNQEYNFNISVQDKQFTNTFIAQYDPFYSSAKNIRLDTGDLLVNATDDQIARMIYKYSKEAYTILDDDNRLDDLVDYKYVQNYVRYKTDIDLCYAIYCSISGKYGVISKDVGDIKISREIKLPTIKSMIERFSELLRPNEDLLKGDDSALVASFVKGNSTTYTVDSRGVF